MGSLGFGIASKSQPAVQQLEGRVLFTKYSISELGFLGSAGPNSAYGFVESDFALSSSYVVGERQRTTGGDESPFISAINKIKFSYLTVPAGSIRAAVNAVNASGVPVGFIEDGNTNDEAVEWKKGKAIDLGSGFANAINKSGEIVGTFDDNEGDSFAVIFGKKITNLGTSGGMGGNGGDALSVNDAGIVVGQALTVDGELHPFLYSGGKMTDLDSSSTTGTAYAINNSDTIVGVVDNVPFTFSKHKLTALPTEKLDGEHGGQALAINDSDVIVGQDNFATDDLGEGVPAAVEWVKNKEYDLNKLIPAGSGWGLSEAISINSAGQIIAIGTGPDGFTDSALLTPKA